MRTCSDRLRLFDTTTITEECPRTSPNDIYRECVATHLIEGQVMLIKILTLKMNKLVVNGIIALTAIYSSIVGLHIGFA